MDSDYTQHQDEHQQLKSQELSRQRAHPPIELPGYEPRSFLGAGAYGEVWVAIDRNTGRKVAIKFYTQKSGVDWSQLSREVEKLVFLSADRYVVQLLDVGWDSDPPYYVMEYVDGGSLQQLLEEEGPLPVGEAVEMFREIAHGLVHAHGKGVLHCDLKPANILLDQDRKPRLADFGQSRLSHEQTPALGTLFFMAPEQADLRAVPDARWDVYALGSLMYCMLTGKSPHRTASVLSEIDSSQNLVGRLENYRNAIKKLPRPTDHRQLAGVDRELAEIIDRCIAVDPAQRFPNVQSVVTALRARDATKDRKPLLLLGLLGPLLFLLVLGLFGTSAYQKSVKDSDNMVRTWVYESSRFAAKFVSEAVARRIDHLYRMTQQQATDDELSAAVQKFLSNEEVAPLRTQLVDDTLDPLVRSQLRKQFVDHPARAELDAILKSLMSRSDKDIASWFVTDAQGLQLASAIPTEETENSTVGLDYSRRAYFHGGDNDFPQGSHYDHPPITDTRLSPVFRSDASGTYKVAISTPIMSQKGARPQSCLGIIALTIEVGKFGNEREFDAKAGRFVTLVDGRNGTHRGQILQHPLFNKLLATQKAAAPEQQAKLPSFSNYKVPIDQLPGPDDKVARVEIYKDPLAGYLTEGIAYDVNWIAAQQIVRRGDVDTGLIVLVQENYDEAAAPVLKLGEALLQRVGIALTLILASFLLLWYLVTRSLRDPNESTRRAGGIAIQSSSLHSMETLEIPEKLREFPKS